VATAAVHLAHAFLLLALTAAIALHIKQRTTIATLRSENEHLHDAHQDALARLDRDDLTGLLNRTGFRRLLANCLTDGDITVILIDVDAFKTINDTHGHAAGDLTLRHLAAVLGDACQSASTPAAAARLSGDEFAVLVDGGMHNAQRFARDLTQGTHLAPLAYNGVAIDIDLSIGIAPHATTDTPLTVDDILARADHAMYHAKRRPAGQPPIATWAPGLHMPPPGEPGDRRLFRQHTPRPSR
jgi:diguanylate cyclase (GGDEF)-like protein